MMLVFRSEFQDAFGLSYDDITSIFQTFGQPATVGEGRTWILRVPPANDFITWLAHAFSVLRVITSDYFSIQRKLSSFFCLILINFLARKI